MSLEKTVTPTVKTSVSKPVRPVSSRVKVAKTTSPKSTTAVKKAAASKDKAPPVEIDDVKRGNPLNSSESYEPV